jgi:hypothetical protein
MAQATTVRFYFDADVLGLAHVVCALRLDSTFPGDPGATIKRRVRPACPVTSPTVKDPDWIPIVTARNWVIISRDSHIASRPAEIATIRDHGARLIALAGPDAGTPWEQLEVLLTHWRAIERLAADAGPWVYTATKTRLRRVEI